MTTENSKPPELSDARVDSWSHLNSDLPVTHSHALKISRFRQCLDQFETSMFIQDSFSVNVSGVRTNWELRVYPNGYDDENSGYLGIFVKHKEGNSHRYLIKSVVQLLDSTGDKKNPVDLPGKVLSSKQMHGTKKYIERDILMQNSDLYIDDSITFLLEAEICQPGTKTSVVENIENDDNKDGVDIAKTAIATRLGTDMLDMLSTGLLSDVIVKCEDYEFTCHKSILAARSPVFAAMFQHDMTEQRKNEVIITDLPHQVVQQMLEYMYSGKFKESADTGSLLAAADKYDLRELKSACEISVAKNISLANCLELVVLADTYSASGLKKSSLSFIVSNLTKVVSMSTWQSQLSSHPHIMAQIIQSMANQSISPSSRGPPNKKRKKELTSFKEALLSAMCSSESEELD